MTPLRKKQQPDVPRRRLDRVQNSQQPMSESAQFRRNQTLSSFRRPATDEASHRQALHVLADKRRKVGGLFLTIAASAIILALLLTQLVAQVSVMSGSTGISRSIDDAAYVGVINEYYAQHPVERLRFALNEPGLLAAMTRQAPEIKAVEIAEVTDFVHAHFSLTFREPIAGWQINNRQYYVDSQGVVFEKNYFDTPGVQIVDDSGVSPEQGSAVASAKLLSFVGRAVHEAGERGYTIESVTLPAGTTRQLELRFEGVTPLVRMTVDRVVEEQVEDADRAWRYLRDNSIAAEYVDVRVEGKAVYR